MRPIELTAPKVWVPHKGITNVAGVTMVVTRVGKKSDTFTLTAGELDGEFISFPFTQTGLKPGRYDGILKGANCQSCVPLRVPCVA